MQFDIETEFFHGIIIRLQEFYLDMFEILSDAVTCYLPPFLSFFYFPLTAHWAGKPARTQSLMYLQLLNI